MRVTVWEAQEGKCGKCAVDTVLTAPLSARNRAELHHIQPKSLGGSDDRSNLINLCSTCHRGPKGIHK